MYVVYVCETHGTQLKNCCKKAEEIGWMDQATDQKGLI